MNKQQIDELRALQPMADKGFAAWTNENFQDLLAAYDELELEKERLRKAYSIVNDEICQTLGKVLGYPWFKDDLKNFPDATEKNGVCVGEHVAETIAEEAAEHIKKNKSVLTSTVAQRDGYIIQRNELHAEVEELEAKLQRKHDEALSRGECVEQHDKLRKVAQAVVDMWHGKDGACVEIRVIQDLENVLEKKLCPKCNDSEFIGGPVGYDCPICTKEGK